MLGAFLNPELRDWVVSDAESQNPYSRHWLARKSAAVAFSEGYFQFKFHDRFKYRVAVVQVGGLVNRPIGANVSPLRFGSFVDHSGFTVDIPDRAAVEVLSRFAKPIRWTYVAREIRQKQTGSPSESTPPTVCPLLEHLSTAVSAIWKQAPVPLRIHTYLALARIGNFIYGPSNSPNVQRLPFGLYLKKMDTEQHQALANEYGALAMVRRCAATLAPRPLDLVSGPNSTFLLMSTVPGYPLGWCIDTLSDLEITRLIHDLQEFLAHIRSITRDAAAEKTVSNAIGTACYDHRINASLPYDEVRGEFVGPFANETEFNDILRCVHLPDVLHHAEHRIVFTHGDLNMRNIIMNNGRLSGIVDWENSGWYPEYWDYTKARYITKRNRRWLDVVDCVFAAFGDYKAEYETEYKLWEYCF
ncbi:kinase-like protein [Coniochaeta ligniaria NRRL 30616]|uniref:Kinase-like protein n=1 Tax=Coniochaeta ligniaria NRRL 30616 TaxID=1408157 RepID=A0A1J7J3Z8_9PEZI|nr:kinase-like protein [Coniochaeta ligniaria NRRL 30616]